MVSRLKIQVPSPKSSQVSCPAALRWRGPLPPLFPPWSPRTASLADQIHWAAFLPGSWAAGLKAMCESLRSFHMKHSGTGSRTRREACPTVQSKHEPNGSACVHTKSIQLQAKQTNATRCYQPPSASPASVESKRRMWRRRWPISGCNRPRARRTPPWLDLGLLICKHSRCAHPKIEPKLWAMLRLRKAHSPRPRPGGLSFSRLSRACCGSCCRSALPHLASHRAIFARYKLLIRIVCSGHKGPRTSLSHRERKHLSALLCTTTDGEANAHVLSIVIQQLQNDARACMTGPASAPPCIGVRTSGHQRGLRMLKAMAIGKVSGQKDACHMTSHDMLIGDWVQHEDFNGLLLWSSNVAEPQLSRVMKEAVHCATSTGLSQVQGILPHLPGAAGVAPSLLRHNVAWRNGSNGDGRVPWCQSSCGSSTIRQDGARRPRA